MKMMSCWRRLLVSFLAYLVLVLTKNNICYGQYLELEPKRKGSGTSKSLRDVVVGNFRITHIIPFIPAPPNDTDYEEAIFQSLYYLRDVLPTMIGVDDIGQDVYYNWTYTSKKAIADWSNYRITYDNDEDLTPEFIFQQVNKSISYNESYTAYMKLLDSTPFVNMDRAVVSDYVEGTSYPTTEPFPTPDPNSTPEPTPSPTHYPTISARPINPPSVEVYVGNLTVAYTSPGITKPEDYDFIYVIQNNDNYFYEVVSSFYSEYYVFTTYDKYWYEYIDPNSSPNLLTNFGSYSIYFDENMKEIPTTGILRQILLDSINSTYIDRINSLDGEPFGTVTEVSAIFTDDIPTSSPTRYPTIPDNTPEPTIVMTDAPVAKSKRKPHGNRI